MDATPADIEAAARLLAAGELVGFPTETVYGLGADAANPAAVRKIFALKGRPADHPLIVHIGDAPSLDAWSSDVPRAALDLARAFWPGPLTIILARAMRVPAEVTGGQETVGLRCPSHPMAQALLAAFARIGSGAIAAPSANRFGHVSPTTAAHVRDEFGEALHVLDGGACEVGLESTIIDLSRGRPVLLRPGAVTREQLSAVLGEAVQSRDADAPRASGTLAAHYAPRTPLDIVLEGELALEASRPSSLAVLAMHEPPPTACVLTWITAPADPAGYGRALYANLRKLDESVAKRIVVEAPPDEPAWEAVNDRLTRAAVGGGVTDEP